MFANASFQKDKPQALGKMGLLLQAGAIADYKGSGEDFDTPLRWSIVREGLKAVELLLSHNADPNQLALGIPFAHAALRRYPV